MTVWATVIAAAAGIVAFFAWDHRRTAKEHARFTRKDVEIALAEFVDPQAHDHDTWDLFLAWPIDDPYLESIRLECCLIRHECPPVPGRTSTKRARSASLPSSPSCGAAPIRIRSRCRAHLAVKNTAIAEEAVNPDGSALRQPARPVWPNHGRDSRYKLAN